MNKEQREQTVVVLHIFHWLITDVLIFIYIFAIPLYYDFYFILILIFQSLHWLILKNECIITYIEKKLININYTLGDDISHNPFEDFIYNKNKLLINAKNIILPLILFILLFYRNKNKKFVYLLIFVFIITIYLNVCKYKPKSNKNTF
jgi:hypothetical protein